MSVIELKCISVTRDKKDNSIISAYLTDGNNYHEIMKNDIKDKLAKGVWKIDSLFLTKDGRLYEKSKDTLISDYEESCRKLGYEPFKLEKVENDYIIVDFPNDKSHLLFPNFATALNIPSGYLKNKSIPNNKNNQENKVNTVLMSSNDSSLIIIKDLKEIKNLINKLGNVVISSDELIKGKLDDINSLIGDFSSLEDNLNDKIVNNLNEIKSFIEVSGLETLKLKENLSPILEQISDESYRIYLNSSNSQDKKVTFSKEPCFVTKDKYICSSESVYNDYIKRNRLDTFVLPYSYIDSLTKFYKEYEAFYDNCDIIFKKRNENELNDILSLMNKVTPFKHLLTFGKDATNMIGSVCEPVSSVTKAFSSGFFALNSLTDLKLDFDKSSKLRKLRNECYDIFHEPNTLSYLFDINDKYIIRYMCEYYYLYKNNGSKKKLSNFEFCDLFSYYEEYSNSALSVLCDEFKKRLAITYIITNKIMDREDLDIGLSLLPNLDIKALSENNLSNIGIFSQSLLESFKTLYYTVYMNVWFTLLLIVGFKPIFAKNQIIDIIVDSNDLSLYVLDKNDLKTLSFDLRDYS